MHGRAAYALCDGVIFLLVCEVRPRLYGPLPLHAKSFHSCLATLIAGIIHAPDDNTIQHVGVSQNAGDAMCRTPRSFRLQAHCDRLAIMLTNAPFLLIHACIAGSLIIAL